MAMCEEHGLATGVHNQYDDTKDWHKCVELRFSLGVCNSRKHNPRGRKRLRRTNISHTDTSGAVHMVLVYVNLQGVKSTRFFA